MKTTFYNLVVGFIPEMFLGFWCSFFLVGFLVHARYVAAPRTPLYGKIANYISISLMIFYGLLIFQSPSETTTLYGLHSTFFIYAIRLLLVFVFILYLIYLLAETKPAFLEYQPYFLMLISFASLNGVLISENFLNLFIFIELYSVTIYYLVLNRRNSVRTSEASFKYFVIGSFSSAVLLFGMMLIYLATGTIVYSDLNILCVIVSDLPIYFWIGLFFFTFAFFIKIGAGFFYFWLLDIYDGAPFNVFIFLNLFVKPAYIIALFYFISALDIEILYTFTRWVLAISLVIGALGALTQTRIKRFIVFTSIYNIGFLSIPFWGPDPVYKGVFFLFLLFYMLNSAAFMMLLGSIRDWTTHTHIKDLLDLANLWGQNRRIVFLLSFFILSLAGLPPLMLFYSKFTFFFLLVTSALSPFWAAIYLISSAVAMFYYIRIIRIMLQGTNRYSIFLRPIPHGVIVVVTFIFLLNIVSAVVLPVLLPWGFTLFY
jgi:NADH-quinone oxidoreductase subunit N